MAVLSRAPSVVVVCISVLIGTSVLGAKEGEMSESTSVSPLLCQLRGRIARYEYGMWLTCKAELCSRWDNSGIVIGQGKAF